MLQIIFDNAVFAEKSQMFTFAGQVKLQQNITLIISTEFPAMLQTIYLTASFFAASD